MKTKSKLTTAIIVCLMLVTGLYGCSNKSEEKTCIVGNKYIKKYIFNEENPFDKARYDTVIILDVQNGYVKYRNINIKDTSFFYQVRLNTLWKTVSLVANYQI